MKLFSVKAFGHIAKPDHIYDKENWNGQQIEF
jgi:hypothetical protein